MINLCGRAIAFEFQWIINFSRQIGASMMMLFSIVFVEYLGMQYTLLLLLGLNLVTMYMTFSLMKSSESKEKLEDVNCE